MNFALIMFVLLVTTGGVWLLDHLFFRRMRAPGAREPWWVEYPKSFFPVILIVFMLRSFLVEPFKIPSGSMLPTLLVGDFILVNKFTYGIRIPIVNVKVVDINNPQRGEVMVFRFPVNPSLDYIKRVVGLSGDKIAYYNKKLSVNGQEVKVVADGQFNYIESGLSMIFAQRFRETFGADEHAILVHPETPVVRLSDVTRFPYHTNCVYNETGFNCTVPQGHFFVMGDNRDSSSDSRYWGFVPDQNIVGKAFLIWWNFDNFRRIGKLIN